MPMDSRASVSHETELQPDIRLNQRAVCANAFLRRKRIQMTRTILTIVLASATAALAGTDAPPSVRKPEPSKTKLVKKALPAKPAATPKAPEPLTIPKTAVSQGDGS